MAEKYPCDLHGGMKVDMENVKNDILDIKSVQDDLRKSGGVLEKIYLRLDKLVTVKTFMWTIVICTGVYTTIMGSVYGFTLSVNQDVKNLTTQVQKETVTKKDLELLKADLKELISNNMVSGAQDRAEIKKDLKELKRR